MPLQSDVTNYNVTGSTELTSSLKYDACDKANNFSEQNVKCSPEDNDVYSDQDFEELGRRCERKITKRKTKGREKKHNKEDSDEEYDRRMMNLKKQELGPRNETPVTLKVTATVITFLTVLKSTARE